MTGIEKKSSDKLTPQRLRELDKAGIPPRPSLWAHIDHKAEIYLYMLATVDGVESPKFKEACAQLKANKEDVIKLVEWGEKYGGGIDYVGPLEAQQAQLQARLDELKEQRAQQTAQLIELIKANPNSPLARFAEDFLRRKGEL